MSSDQSAPAVRERVWVEKIDRSGPEPVVVESAMFENGALVSVDTTPRPATPEEVAATDAAAAREPVDPPDMS